MIADSDQHNPAEVPAVHVNGTDAVRFHEPVCPVTAPFSLVMQQEPTKTGCGSGSYCVLDTLCAKTAGYLRAAKCAKEPERLGL